MNIHDAYHWLVAALVAPIVVGIFKDELTTTIRSVSTFFSNEFEAGDVIQIQGLSGGWEDAIIEDISLAIPFFRKPGVTILQWHDFGRTRERVPFHRFQELRKRHVIKDDMPKSVDAMR